MKKYIYLMLSVVLAGVFGACSKDDPFDVGNTSNKEGYFMKSALDVTLGTEGPRSLKNSNVRAVAPSVNDFKVEFINPATDEAVVTYERYAAMPEIVTLPVGEYYVRASYGDNPAAAFDAPYYAGQSGQFAIWEDKFTDDVEEIVCKIANVRVSVVFEESLRKAMSKDSKVTVKVGDVGSLDFTVADVDAGRSGYFAYVKGSNSLAATFSGVVDGGNVVETKDYSNVEPGNHYSIIFRLHDASQGAPGNIQGDDIIIVDATVTTEDMSRDVDDQENVVEDDMRPAEGEPTPDDPGTDEPGDPDAAKPTITADAPYVMNQDQEIQEAEVVMHVHSAAEGGIQSFKVEIDSQALDENELSGVGLNRFLDLIEPGEYEEGLKDLGFPVKDEVKGRSDVTLSISADFMTLLKLLGTSYHHFILSVTDANGQTVSTLKFVVK